jgi:hypothetical protein
VRVCNAAGTGWSACAGEVVPCGPGTVCCAAPQTCGGGGVPNQCGCTATTCAALGRNCGLVGNGCGGQLNCGTCNGAETCGGGGVPGVCGTPTGSCSTPADCPGSDTFCRTRTCTANMCGTVNTSAGAPLPSGQQTAGDCQVLECDGVGSTTSQQDNSDLPPPQTCKVPQCTAGVPNYANAAVGSACTKPGGGPGVCDLNSNCN